MSWVKYAKIGDKIVCVNTGESARAKALYPTINVVKEGQVYTIRDFVPIGDLPMLHLVEVDNSHLIGMIPRWPVEVAFEHWGFLPVDHKPIDMSVFTDLLIKAPDPDLVQESQELEAATAKAEIHS